MKLDNKIFIETLTTEDIPWQLLEGPYERASNFPKWITSLTNENEISTVADMKEKIAINFEHQGTLWSVTPFVMLILRKTLNEVKNPVTIAYILDLFEIIYEIANTSRELYKEKIADPLPLFSEMLYEENLLPPLTKDYVEEDLLIEYCEKMSNELLISFFYYSWLVLAYSINHDFPVLKKNQEECVLKRLEKFENKAVNLFLNDILVND